VLRRTAVVLGVALVACVRPAPAWAEDDALRALEYRNDRLTLHARESSLDDVISEIGRKSGARIRGSVCRQRKVIADFEDMPLPAALEDLLRDQNFVLRYGPNDELRAVELLGQPLPPEAANGATPGASSAATAHASASGRAGGGGSSRADGTATAAGVAGGPASAHGDAAGQLVPLAVGQGGKSGTSTAPPEDQKLDEPTADDLRRRVRRNVLSSIDQMDDAALADFMQTPEGQAVANLIAYYASHHRGSDRQQQALDIIHRMPTPPHIPKRVR